MLLWYAKFICQQPAHLCFDGFVKVSAQGNCGWRGWISGVELDFHLQVCADGFGFFQDICRCLLPYDSGNRAQANIFSCVGGNLCLCQVAVFFFFPGGKVQAQQRCDQCKGEKNAT